MEAWANKIVSKWNDEGVKINCGATLDLIESTEKILNFKFPDNFKKLYREMNGFQELDWQEHMFHFWPLEKIIEVFDDSNDKDFIGFCDFFLSVNHIGFRKSIVGIYKIYPSAGESEVKAIAGDFAEIIEMINTNSGSIY